jgi:hypothetical protein
MDATIQTEQARYRVKPTAPAASFLAPVALFIDTGAASVADWLTPEQARELGDSLLAVADQVVEAEAGSVLDAADDLVAAGDRLDHATGESRR